MTSPGPKAKPVPILDPMMAVIRRPRTGEVVKVMRLGPEWEVVTRVKLPEEDRPCRRRSGRS